MENILSQNAQTMKEFEENFQQKLIEAKQKNKERKVKPIKIEKRNRPFPAVFGEPERRPFAEWESKVFVVERLTNCKTGTLYLGRKNGNPPNDIVLGGLGINPNHAVMSTEQGQCWVDYYREDEVKKEDETTGAIYVNGFKIENKTQIHHMDRLVFGMSGIFL